MQRDFLNQIKLKMIIFIYINLKKCILNEEFYLLNMYISLFKRLITNLSI